MNTTIEETTINHEGDKYYFRVFQDNLRKTPYKFVFMRTKNGVIDIFRRFDNEKLAIRRFKLEVEWAPEMSPLSK